jgi:class 3 adenylate cyclase/tetratricopeptide (TPR) repeat protein
MNCPHCQHANPPSSKFCLECGLSLAQRCARCSAELPPSAKFCNECGQQVGAPAADAVARDPRAYTPKHLADKILQSKSALEGERKQVTVLFADVKGSMELAEQMDPEEWSQIMQRFFQILSEGVERFEGFVDKFTGDGIMALFGAPIAHEDHAQRACHAALYMRDALRGYSDELRRSVGLSFSTRIGLNSGDVVVGKIGDDLRMDYTAQGHTVGLAQRMEQLAEPGKPYLAPRTTALVEGFFVLDDLGDFRVKGAAEPLRVHALAGVGEAHTRLEVARLRGLSRFVGRVREMESLEAAMALARKGCGQVVGVVGEAGGGKSRLCLQFVDRARAGGTAVYEAHCRSHAKTVSFLPMLDLLRALLGISKGETDQEQQRKIAREPILLDKSFGDVLGVVLDFLGVADAAQPALPVQAEARQRQLFHFVRRLVQDRGAREAAVLFIDDVHWIDAASDALLAQIVEAVINARAFLLVNFRPEYRAEWMGKPEYHQLPLRRLASDEIEALLDGLIGHDATASGLRDLIRERTDGNPFFVEELVHSLTESGLLEGTLGRYRLVEPIETLEVPATVQSVVATRIDRLREREKQALQTASVIGREFSEPILSAVLDWPDGDLSKALRELKNGEFVYERSLYPVTEYAFKHPLTQEVALSSQLRERRARTHAAVARALEAANPERLDEQAALIAHHYEGAEQELEAARWHRHAAEWALKSDNGASAMHWRRVYELAKTDPSTPEAMALELAACGMLVAHSYASGLSDVERDHFATEGRELADRLGDRAGLFMIENGLALARNLTGGSRESPLVPMQRAIEIAEDLGPEFQFIARGQSGNVLWGAGRVIEALRATDEAIELAGGDLELGTMFSGFSLANFLMCQRGALLLGRGRPREAVACLEQSLKVASERNEPLPVCQINCWYGAALEDMTGSSQQSLFRGQQAIEHADLSGSEFNRTSAWLHMGWAQLMHGDLADALESLLRVDHLQRELGVGGSWLNLGQGLLAEAHLAAGNADNARIVANRCTADRDTWAYELRAHLSRSRVLRTLDGADAQGEIEATLARAQHLLKESGALAFAPFIVEERARLFEVLGDAEGAAQGLCEAQRAFAEVEATGHAARLAKELGSR